MYLLWGFLTPTSAGTGLVSAPPGGSGWYSQPSWWRNRRCGDQGMLLRLKRKMFLIFFNIPGVSPSVLLNDKIFFVSVKLLPQQIFIDDIRSSIEKILVEEKVQNTVTVHWKKISQSETHKLKFWHLLLFTQLHLKTDALTRWKKSARACVHTHSHRWILND